LTFQFFDLIVFLGDVLVSLLDLFIVKNFLSLELDLVIFELLDFVLLVHHLLFILEQLVFKVDDFLGHVGLVEGELVNLCLLCVDLFLKLS